MNEKYVKKFDEWNEYAKHLDIKESPLVFNAKEIWWCAIGINVGSEQDGKNEYFERPVLILKRIGRDMVIISPITSSINNYKNRIDIVLLGKESQILILHTKVISTKRLLRKISTVKNITYIKVLLMTVKMYTNIFVNDTKSETPQ